MKHLVFLLGLTAFVLSTFAQQRRAPANPLITHDPYFSIWSFSDTLNSTTTKHWTGTNHALGVLIKVDNKVYSFLGKPESSYETLLPTDGIADYVAKYTVTAPDAEWEKPDYKDSGWKFGNVLLVM